MGKNVLITGSSDGIGAEIAAELSKCGYNIFITGRNEAKLFNLCKKLNTKNFLAGDLSDFEFCKELYNTANEKLQGIDILINNAGAYVWSPIESTSIENIDKIFRLNLEVPYYLCSLAVPYMKKNHYGRIVNIGSISAMIGEINASLYSSSKSGLIGLTKSLALELAEYNINVNLINPGWVKTKLTECHFEENSLCCPEDEIEAVPQKRWIEPIEIAYMVKYLVSDEAKGVTGQAINLCAGLSI